MKARMMGFTVLALILGTFAITNQASLNGHGHTVTNAQDYGEDVLKEAVLEMDVEYRLRVKEPNICDPNVQQYSGYLDISNSKHLFFWFFESRSKPDEAPLILWLSGGPGCSSLAALLFDVGPCMVANEGKNLTNNPFSWNSRANIIFLDQPINVGFSYSDDGSTINNSPEAALDVYAFLQKFMARYPKYANSDLHIATRSYGGTYAPNLASVIHQRNKALDIAPISGVKKINLMSVMIGNGIADPHIQDASIPAFACDGPYPLYDPRGSECRNLRDKASICKRLTSFCYRNNNRLACLSAALYCNSQLYGPLERSGRNPYDVRRTCDPREDTSICYKQMDWIETWINDNKEIIGAFSDIEFTSCNLQVSQAFYLQADRMHNSAMLLTDLVNDGIRLLVYAGNADSMCNFIGNERWVVDFENVFHDEFVKAKPKPWITLQEKVTFGTVRSAGGGGLTAGNVTFVTVHEAGHMVPYDQPQAALDLLVRWINNMPLTI
ncbi:serine carboxypeptidase [Schizopora paradoxa]|uniref:Serine carboxypeptidase n=1 Tax=Schizopora paradoxa TaxID=27342 RepID=A0A0H2RZ73_9AGAM|nr:serine carboxypeptidase [Schizopora paradoxa]